MSSLQDQLKEIEKREENYKPISRRVEKLDYWLKDIESTAGCLSFLIILGFAFLLFNRILSEVKIAPGWYILAFYGGCILVFALQALLQKQLPRVLYFLHGLGKKEYQQITEKRDKLKTERSDIIKRINQENRENYRDREKKLVEQLEALVEISQKRKLAPSKISETKNQLEIEHAEIKNFGYQIHTNIYYVNRFTKIDEALGIQPSNVGPVSTPIGTTESSTNSKQIQTTIPKPTEEKKAPISGSKQTSEIKIVPKSPITNTNKEKPIPKGEEKTSSELFDNADTEVVKQESAKTNQPKPSVKIDFPKLNEHRHNIGELGELYVFEKEQNHLISQGKINQSKEIIHVSLTNDAEGYDIISFTDTGERKYIEVKTTTGNEFEPFYLSDSEMQTMNRLNNYWIYRVYNFNIDIKKGDLYKIDCKKDFGTYYNIHASSFKVTPKR